MKPPERQGEEYLARGFRDVDAAAVGKMVRCLTYMDGLPEFQQYKNTILEMMNPQPGSITADLGCGLGFDVRRLAKLVGSGGRAIGVDASLTLLESARAASKGFPAVDFIQADIHSLPFASGFLHSCKVDRTLQHVERPDAVLSEIFRTVRPGGRVVCADPDWGTFAIEASTLGNAEHPVARQVAQLWSQDIRNPRMGHDLGKLLEEQASSIYRSRRRYYQHRPLRAPTSYSISRRAPYVWRRVVQAMNPLRGWQNSARACTALSRL